MAGLKRWMLSRLPAGTIRRLGLIWLRRVIAAWKVGDRVGSVAAEVVAEATPYWARQRNQDRVRELLDSAGVSYLCLPSDGIDSLVVVDRASAERVRALMARVRAEGGHWAVANQARARGGVPAALEVCWPAVDPSRRQLLGREYACRIQFWRTVDGELVDPYSRVAGDRLPAEPSVPVPSRLICTQVRQDDASLVPSHPAYLVPAVEHVSFPIDVVYTWVDGDDPDWRERKRRAIGHDAHAPVNAVAAADSRFTSHDELRYSLRSIHSFAPWVRRIFLVTDDQVPAWLDLEHPRVTVVPHAEIFADPTNLPTFNSHAIESQLYRIPDLAEHFIYFNDDMFLGRPVAPSAFFYPTGMAKFFVSVARIGRGPADGSDPPVDAAGKNNRDRIIARFDRRTSAKMRHIPYPLRRSVLTEIATELASDVANVASHRFRHPDDLSIPSSLAHYWAFHTGRAVPAEIKYAYADLSQPEAATVLARLLRRRHCDVFCVNETDLDPGSVGQWSSILADFLATYFPFRAPFELPEPIARGRAQLSATRRFGVRSSPGAAPAPVKYSAAPSLEPFSLEPAATSSLEPVATSSLESVGQADELPPRRA